MGRPTKIGLDYFPLDVNIDDNLELIEAEHGLQGFAIVVKLWQKIYSNGYYILWNEDSILLFAKKINAELMTVNSVINSCFKRIIFDEKLFNTYKILTSSGIQKRYLTVCSQSKRKSISFISEFKLVNLEFTDIITEFIELPIEFSTQSKVKESKVKESKVNNTELIKNWKNDFQIYISQLRTEYNKLIVDSEFILTQEKYHPNVDIKLSIEKACVNFWATEAGWIHKRKSRVNEINWKSTLTKAIDLNKVYKDKSAQTINGESYYQMLDRVAKGETK